LAVRNKKQAFNLVISNCQSIIINKEDKENNRYEFTYGTTESKETEGCIRKDASFGNEEGEKDYCNRGLGSCTYHKGESDFNYTAYAVFKKFDKDAMKIYFDFKITKQPVGGEKVSYADAMTINIAKAQ